MFIYDRIISIEEYVELLGLKNCDIPRNFEELTNLLIDCDNTMIDNSLVEYIQNLWDYPLSEWNFIYDECKNGNYVMVYSNKEIRIFEVPEKENNNFLPIQQFMIKNTH